MIEWVNVKEKPFPKDGENYLALFMGQFCIFRWYKENKKYQMGYTPEVFSGISIIERDYENQITHWAKLILPEDY